MKMRSRGFTLIDLVVVIACAAILVTLSACIPEAYEQSYRSSCQAYLRGIGFSIDMYRFKDPAGLPLLFASGQPDSNIRSTDVASSLDELKTRLAGRETAMQNMWVLIDDKQIEEYVFACPADRDYKPRKFKDQLDKTARWVGWHSSANFSFGLHFPYESTKIDGDMIENPAPINSELKDSFIIMADKNPSRTNEPIAGVGPGKTPSNHGEYGQLYLTFGGAVQHKSGSEDSKVNGDDIYTINKENNTNLATPAGPNDTYITRHPMDE
ncbi:MAG: type II secretion system protein [Phycisphaerae bacterium]|nr:type II secretion system protein [Phycisphaerae bacterium]